MVDQYWCRNDHQPLVTIQKKPYAKAPMRLQRMLMRSQNYDYEIVYVPGKKMLIADALSRATVGQEGPGREFDVVQHCICNRFDSR